MFHPGWYGSSWYGPGWWPAGVAASSAAGTPWITPRELASARRSAERSLPGVAVIYRRTALSDGQGGQTWSWGEVETVRCRLAPRAADERVQEGRLATVTGWQLLLPWGTELYAVDRVVVAGEWYEIVETEAPRPEAVFTAARAVRVV